MSPTHAFGLAWGGQRFDKDMGCKRWKAYEEPDMTKTLSVSPQRVVLAPGYAAPASEVEDLIAGRQRERTDVVYQSIFQRLIRGEEDFQAAPLAQNVLRNGGPLG